MRRAFVKNILFILGLNVLIKSIWIFMIDRTVQNRVGHDAYGEYQAIFNLGLILQIVLDFGLNNYNNRLVAQQPDRLSRLFPKMISARLLLMVFYAVILFSVAWVLGYNGWQLMMLTGIMVFQSFTILLQYIRSNISGLQHFRTDSVLSVADRALMIVIGSVLLFAPGIGAGFRIEWFVYAQVASYGLAMVVAFLILRRLAAVSLRLSFHLGEILSIIRGSFPYALLVFLMSVYTRADAILIKNMVSANETGIYASAMRLLDVGNILGLMFSTILLPLFGRMLSEKKDVVPIIRISVNAMLPVALMVSVAAFCFGTSIMEMLYTAAGPYDGKVFAWYMSCFPAFCMMYIYSTLLTANGNIKLLVALAAIGVIINFSLNFYMIPRYGAYGAGITAFITQGALAIGYIIAAQKRLSLPVGIKWASAHIAYAALIIPAGYAATLLPADWKVQLAVFGLVSAVLMFVFRFISIHNLKQLLNRS